MHNLRVVIMVLVVGYGQAQDRNCDFTQNVEVGRQYAVQNLGYPNSYARGAKCRWIANCPSGYNCRLDCDDIDLPQTDSCNLDRLLISRSGDTTLTAADYYCGRGTLVAVSTGQRICVGLITNSSSPGGRFRCTLSAQPSSSSAQCSCGYKKMNRIVGGQPTGVNEYPMMAGLIYRSEGAIKCGATIIQPRYVLSAAHCVYQKSVDELGVVVGEHDTSTGSDTSYTRGFGVTSYKTHEQYSPSTLDYDIAVVMLNGQIQYNDAVGPVCLPFKFTSYDFTNQKVTLLGWGTQFTGGPTSNVLRKVDVNVISQASCARNVSTLTPRQMCTYTKGKDACQDDSGGPLLFTDPSTNLLFDVGIVSFGRFCASQDPGVNTRITTLLNWIQTNAPGNYCMK